MTDREQQVRVSDPVHGYIALTPLERSLLDTAAAQRLRYVGQSGLVHLVFPDVRTSRFIHSLGAMHLASRFLLASLEHAEPEDRHAALNAVKAAVKIEIADFGSAKVCAEQLEKRGLVCEGAVSETYRPYVLIAEQGLRLAALFHDLGHLPFSHDFEFALQELKAELSGGLAEQAQRLLLQEAGRDALHERIGHALTYLLLQQAFDHEPLEAHRVSFKVARKILETSNAKTVDEIQGTGGWEKPVEGAWAWLHTLIAGELDVDRCDYVLRDARNYGFESARFDLERLIDNLTVVRDPNFANAFVPAVLMQGQAAVEAFLIARARVYQWGTRHHKVGQVAAALRHTIGELLRPVVEGSNTSGEIAQFLDDLDLILSSQREDEADDEMDPDDAKDLLMRFAGYDDQWWMSMLRAEHQDDEWFRLVCWRGRGPKCLWKRAVDFPIDRERETIRDWNMRLPDRTDVEGRRAWDDAVRELRKDGVLVIRHRFEPWKPSKTPKNEHEPESALSFYVPENPPGERLVSVSSVSYSVAALREGWLRDLQVHAYRRSAEIAVSGDEVLDRLNPHA